MNRSRLPRFVLVLPALLLSRLPAAAQEEYQKPPRDILEILDAPSPPSARFSPDYEWLLISEEDRRDRTIAELAEPTYTLAGYRINPRINTRIELTGMRSAMLRTLDGAREIELDIPSNARVSEMSWSPEADRVAYLMITEGAMSLWTMELASGTPKRIESPELEGVLGRPSWSHDGKYIGITTAIEEGVAFAVVNVTSSTVRRVTPREINHVVGGCSWLQQEPLLLCRMFPGKRGAKPEPPQVPEGPIVQESYGRPAPTRTYTQLLSNPYEEALFDYYFTDQIAIVDLDGTVTPVGPPAVHSGVAPSPSGDYLLTTTIQRPYSYQVRMGSFPHRTEVWDLTGRIVKRIAETPLRDAISSARDAVAPGIRRVAWRPDVPATVTILEALDGGEPDKNVSKRDRVSLLAAPFTGDPELFVETELRYAEVNWYFTDLALLSERSHRTNETRTWVIDPSQPASVPRLLWDRRSDDRYSDPGDFVMVLRKGRRRSEPLRSKDGKWMYITGSGASPRGDRPFLDRIDIKTGKAERLWQSEGPYHETIVTVLDASATKVITQRESVTEPPNYFLRDLKTNALTQLTRFDDEMPVFSEVTGQRITYKRKDGVLLSATLYLPPGYDESQGPLPFLVWAYPGEFRSADAASQATGSPYQFRRPSRADHLLLLTQGYGVLDGPTMPIVGRNGGEPNDNYVEDLVASAQAAVDEIVRRGVADRSRIGIGGHSYGAFMTANLLAHSDLFRAGIARSGAYNRTLTPFGFQSEPRTYWQAPDVYNAMSAFMYADQLDEPILLIHGMIDSNAGTFPIQSERLFQALKGNSGAVRYVQLPYEGHAYTAKESRHHVLWEMVTWLDKHVKNAKAAATSDSSH